MKRKQIPLFATQSDLSALVREVSCNRPLEFVVGGLFDQPTLPVLSDLENPQPFMTYLVFDKGSTVVTRAVPQHSGGQKYAVDQMENPQTVAVQCGGMLDEHRLIAGQIGTVAVGKQAEEIYELFAKAIRRKFEKIKSYYVGPEAVLLLDKGVRLTPTTKSPETYDLVR